MKNKSIEDYIFNIIDKRRYLTETMVLAKVANKFKEEDINYLESIVTSCLERSKLRKLYYLYGNITEDN